MANTPKPPKPVINSAPNIWIDDVVATEGINPNAIFTVHLSRAHNDPIILTYQLSSGGTITATIPAGQTSLAIALPIADDQVFELDQTVTATLVSATAKGKDISANITDGVGVATIHDNDQPPSFSVNNVTANEGDGTMTFTVTKTGATAVASSVHYAINMGTTDASDFTGQLSGDVSFLANETSKQITVHINDDSAFEGVANEQFTVNLSNAVNATISGNLGVGTILDNDLPPAPDIAVSSGDVMEGGVVTHLVVLRQPYPYDIEVTYRTSDGYTLEGPGFAAATAGADYVATTGTVIIPAGSVRATF
jgi:hypothetical protein